MKEISEKMNPFNAKHIIETINGPLTIYRLDRLEEIGIGNISRLPYSIKILLESLLRNVDGKLVTEHDVELLAKWDSKKRNEEEIPFIPARVILQDLTGVPLIVDLAALRSAMQQLGEDPARINPVIPVDLIIDHSVQVDYYGTSYALMYNEKKEFERNRERYSVLRWAQTTFDNFHVVPPNKGIVHQINLEYLASVVCIKKVKNELIAYPDSVIGTDSHTTMINGLGVLGWGVGGIEAETVLLGQPYYMPIPEVVGFKLYGELKENVTATDLVITITELLRNHGVVDKIVEFYGPGLKKLGLPDRATIGNMSPEYGATAAFFPIDNETLNYMLRTDRDKEHVETVKRYAMEQGLFYRDDLQEPLFSDNVELDMSIVEPSLAGPKRPQDRIPLDKMRETFQNDMENTFPRPKGQEAEVHHDYSRWLGDGGSGRTEHIPLDDNRINIYTKYHGKAIKDGSIVIAAITSCTNTSNPYIMIGAGILAKKAVKYGLKAKSYVKTSLAPGSMVVTDYFTSSGLLPYLEALGFHLVGYGCTTCIGNSGHIAENIAEIIKENDLVVAAILSGNRNFEGRINPLVRANYLASPPLVVAFAIAGSVDIDLKNEPLGHDPNGMAVYLKDIWPKKEEIDQIIKEIDPKMFKDRYEEIFEGTKLWYELNVPRGELYKWNNESTYIQEPPFFKNFSIKPPGFDSIKDARVLVLLGNSITTDHISPAGEIPVEGSAGTYLTSIGVRQKDFNSFGSRRGNHEVMMRGTFGNIHLQNKLVPNKEGGWTICFHNGKEMTIYDAAMIYKTQAIPLIIIAKNEYGSGSSRDWAAKGTYLLGVHVVIAESYERIHRSNLVGMGVLPLQFKEGDSAEKLGIEGNEIFDIVGLSDIKPRGEISVLFRDGKGKERRFDTIARLDSDIELEYYRNGGILQTFLRNILKK